jgi:crotonobetainyl-CoA:carnitine CoA-transferase CaiB-like acyl-CoA transferase
MPASKGILHGLRVLDLSRMLSGPYCTMMLADHGAEVIKIESASGDTSRANGPFRDDDPDHQWAGYFVSLNRSKKSVALDLKTKAGVDALKQLVKSADVLVENFRPGVMDRLGLSYETLSEINPQIVYAAIRGFGDPRTGQSPYANWPSYDVVAQAMGGIMAITGPDAQTPTKVGPGVGDIFSGMVLAFGIMGALRQAEATGVGQFVDVAMYDAMISLCERAVYLHDFTGVIPGPEGNDHPFLAPFGLFKAKDGAVALGIVDDGFWQALAGVIGTDGLSADPKFATRAARAKNRQELNALVARWTSTFTKAALAQKLGGLIPFGPMHTIADIVTDPHVIARQMLATIPNPDNPNRPWHVAANPLKFSLTPAPTPSPPPRIGQNTLAYLQEINPPGASDQDKRNLRNAFGAFATGVTVVTTREQNGTPRGFTANSFTSVSLDPPILLICIAKSALSQDVFANCTHFGINILAADQRETSNLFASRSSDKFEKTDWFAGHEDVPILAGTVARFVCKRDKCIDAGDHFVLFGQVCEFKADEGIPLGYFKGNYFSVEPNEQLLSAASKFGAITVGAVLSRDDKLLLSIAHDQTLSVPHAPTDKPDLSAFTSALAALGLHVETELLYAVYQDSETGVHGIYYHGTVQGDAPAGYGYFPIQNLPIDRIGNKAQRAMLVRFAEESVQGSFGIYQGNETAGTVQKISHKTPSKHQEQTCYPNLEKL